MTIWSGAHMRRPTFFCADSPLYICRVIALINNCLRRTRIIASLPCQSCRESFFSVSWCLWISVVPRFVNLFGNLRFLESIFIKYGGSVAYFKILVYFCDSLFTIFSIVWIVVEMLIGGYNNCVTAFFGAFTSSIFYQNSLYLTY